MQGKLKSSSVVLMPNWIGDIVMALVAVHKMTPRPSILVQDRFVEMCKMLSSLDVLGYSRKSFRKSVVSARKSCGNNFQKMYVLPLSFSTACISFFCGIPNRRGIVREGRGLFLTEKISKSIRTKQKHLLFEYASVLEIDEPHPHEWQEKHFSGISDIRARGKVVLCPGAQFGPSKQWHRFPELIAQWKSKEFLILGGPADSAFGESLVDVSPDRVSNLAGKTSLIEAIQLIEGADLIVSNDSGLMHIAAYLQKPTIGIFGSTSSTWTRPCGSKVTVVQSDESCSPCFDKTCRFGHYNCQKILLPEKISMNF